MSTVLPFQNSYSSTSTLTLATTLGACVDLVVMGVPPPAVTVGVVTALVGVVPAVEGVLLMKERRSTVIEELVVGVSVRTYPDTTAYRNTGMEWTDKINNQFHQKKKNLSTFINFFHLGITIMMYTTNSEPW